MTRTGIAAVATAVLLLAAHSSFAEVRLERPERRPYIIEVGQPYPIGGERLAYEVQHISAAREYVRHYGYPDYAEIQEISPEWPWEAYELRLYYMRPNFEVDFSPVFLSEALPNFGVLKSRAEITPEKRHEIDVVLEARQAPSAPVTVVSPPPAPAPAPPVPPSAGGLSEALVARIEAAAERAAQAADRAAQDSEAAARAAERTVNIVDKMEQERGVNQ